jgi:hypothetical protein
MNVTPFQSRQLRTPQAGVNRHEVDRLAIFGHGLQKSAELRRSEGSALPCFIFHDRDLFDRLKRVELSTPVLNHPSQKTPHRLQIIVHGFGCQPITLPSPRLERVRRNIFDCIPMAILNQLVDAVFQIAQILVRFSATLQISKKIIQMVGKLSLCRLSDRLGQDQSIPLEKSFLPQLIPAFFRASFIRRFERNVHDLLVVRLLAEFPAPDSRTFWFENEINHVVSFQLLG